MNFAGTDDGRIDLPDAFFKEANGGLPHPDNGLPASPPGVSGLIWQRERDATHS
jgi:hypothetical protein